MRFNTDDIDGILVIYPPRMDLDASKADEFKKDIAPVIDGHTKVIMDMENIGFMDSAGLGAILSVFKKVRAEGGQFKVYGLHGEVKDLFELVRMQRLFDIHKDRDSAVSAFQE